VTYFLTSITMPNPHASDTVNDVSASLASARFSKL